MICQDSEPIPTKKDKKVSLHPNRHESDEDFSGLGEGGDGELVTSGVERLVASHHANEHRGCRGVEAELKALLMSTVMCNM